MKFHQSANQILSLFWFDVFTLSLVSIASFLTIGAGFSGIAFLGLALSLRTLSSAISSHFIGRLTAKINSKRLLIYSQVLSFLIILMLIIGFSSKNKILILLGITLLGIPYVCKNVFMTIYFKFLNAQDDAFRKKSGRREFIFGLARLCSCVFSPFLLFYFGINTIMFSAMLISVLSFVFSLTIQPVNILETDTKKDKATIAKIFSHAATWEYICKCSAVLLPVSFIALLASSDQLLFSSHIPKVWRQLFWAIEALTMVIGSYVYIKFKLFFKSKIIGFMIMLNSISLLLLLLSDNITVLALSSGILSLLIMMGFYIFRDDYILAAGNNDELIRGFSSFSSVQQYIMYTVSPLFLASLFEHCSLFYSIFIILVLQFVLLILSVCIVNICGKNEALVINVS